MPEAGKYNAGQKLVFWALTLLIPVMLVTGVMVWEGWFSWLAPIPAQRVALIVHAVAAVAVILVMILHIYAAIFVRGSFGAMLSGRVSPGWAYRHHRKWFRRLAEHSPNEDHPAI
jgi:formate dehydrogenase subunit gamma